MLHVSPFPVCTNSLYDQAAMICTGNNYNTNIDQQAMESKSADNFFGEIFQISNYFRKGKEGEEEKIHIKKIEIKTKKGGRGVENADPVDLPPRRSLTDPPKIGGCSSHDSTASAIPPPSPIPLQALFRGREKNRVRTRPINLP